MDIEKAVSVERLVEPVESTPDVMLVSDLRPTRFDQYPGQETTKENLKVYVKASLRREAPLDHVLLHGPPGLGKTTLAHIVANELGVPFYSTSGPSIDKPGDLAGMLAGLEEGALLFIDEIHRLSIQVEEVLYSAMEDFVIDVVVGQGTSARSVRMPIAPFTLVGATTKVSNLSRPLISRFGIQERLEFYNDDALIEIITRSASILEIDMNDEGAEQISKCSRGTPRIANRLLKRVWDFAEVEGDQLVDKEIALKALNRLEIDESGLDRTDREILNIILERYNGGPVGIETLAVTLGEERSTIEEVYEPFLVHQGYLARGSRGRFLTDKGKDYLANLLV
jgi:Holliday junction DNA helicase RuvB